MSSLQKIQLIQFKNHLSTQNEFNSPFIGITGKNGTGKTNLLDAIYYLCFARSYFIKSDKLLQHFNYKGFRLDGTFIDDGIKKKVKCIVREDGKKEIYIDEEPIKRTSDFLGYHTCVMIAPDDIEIINEGSEIRRKFLDTILCQIDKTYLTKLQQYNKVMMQRNGLLKQLFETNAPKNELIEVYNEQLHDLATYIYGVRKEKFVLLKEQILHFYKEMATVTDGVDMSYESQLHDAPLSELLKFNFQKDLYSQRTNYGIHKDDLSFTMGTEALKTIASQGQKKSFLLSLKLSEFTILNNYVQHPPILLLDDIFERLDDARIEKLFRLIITKLNCQVFITDTSKLRLESSLSKFTKNYEVVEVNGNVG
jgi:DNA replication and repair protein RecF